MGEWESILIFIYYLLFIVISDHKQQSIMGFLDVKGKKLTYNEYNQPETIQKYKRNGLLQFINIFNAHKDRHIQKQDLHWGEEMEYTLFMLDQSSKRVWLSAQGYDLISSFNQQNDPNIQLQPEFGNWMVEAVPKEPYNSTEDLQDLMSCDQKVHER